MTGKRKYAFFGWWVFGLTMTMNATDSGPLIEQLESISQANIRIYQLKTDQRRRMDCLKVFQPDGVEFRGNYFGLYHRLDKGVFDVHLTKSSDLRDWQDIDKLDDHASQPTIHQCEDGRFLVAYEKDAPNSCWIRLRWYDRLGDLLACRFSREFDVARTLAPTAEGTPSIESVSMGEQGLDDSLIRLRFHYFKGVRVDQLASGTLTGFKAWQSEASETINKAFVSAGWRGNLGDRDRFNWGEKVYYLQETQKKRRDWSSWRIQLCDAHGMPIRQLQFRTNHGSKSFANPNVTWVTDGMHQRQLVVTLFLPSEGNHLREAGTLLYIVQP